MCQRLYQKNLKLCGGFFIHLWSLQWRAEVRAIFLNVDKPLAEKSPRPGHRRVTAIHQNTRALPSFEGYESTSTTNTREPTQRTADYSSASTTLHYKQLFCQDGLLWEGVTKWKEKKKWQSVRKQEKKIKEGTKKEQTWKQVLKIQPNDPPNDPRTTPPKRPLIHELSNAGPRAIIDHNMKCATPCATAPLLHPWPSNKEDEPPSHPKEVCKRNDQRDVSLCKLNMLEQPQQISKKIYNMVNQESNGNTWIWPTKASKTTQQIIANLIGTATIATKSFAQWYGLKSKESLRLWPLTVTVINWIITYYNIL